MSVTVRVALRVRPFNEKEKKDNNLILFTEDPQQIRIQDQTSFTFDYVYPPEVSQAEVYGSCIQPLFDQFTKGYNATILAYGQTGSGKTYSMGTSSQENDGIVPRFAENLFQHIHQDKTYQVSISFLELYHEDLKDLLNTKNTSIHIREDVFGNISWSGVHDQVVENTVELLRCLYQGSLKRTTGTTDMNSNSSRSHAIFTVTLTQSQPESVTVSKFHVVDLAGSERLKRTNAKGNRAKEGISINAGLLALGNVISALGSEKKKSSFVPYRNSKLTRLLQDSLGGNSQTLMLACVSPAECNANETLSTLKYANRAKNITNRVIINQKLSELDVMKQEIIRLRNELKLNDAFMKEVHLELDVLRLKNLQLRQEMDDGATLVESISERRSTSTKRKKKSPVVFLDKHRNRLKKEALFIKQMKSNNHADPELFNKLLTMFQTSIREQRQLVNHIELLPSATEEQKPVAAQQQQQVTKKGKPSLIKQPTNIKRISTSSNTEQQLQKITVVVEEQMVSDQLKKMSSHIKKAQSLLANNDTSQLKSVLSKMSSLCQHPATSSITTTTTKSSEILVASSKKPPTSNYNKQRVNLSDIHRQISRLISFENIKSSTVCTEMSKSLKQKKLQLVREQKDLLQERKTMLKEFYPHHEYNLQQQKQQYMDERIDIITVQLDFVAEQLKLLQPSIANRMDKTKILEVLKPLSEQDLRSLVFMMIQQDFIKLNVTTHLFDVTQTALTKYQQAMIQLRRDSPTLNSHILLDLCKAVPIKCLSNGLLVLSQ